MPCTLTAGTGSLLGTQVLTAKAKRSLLIHMVLDLYSDVLELSTTSQCFTHSSRLTVGTCNVQRTVEKNICVPSVPI